MEAKKEPDKCVNCTQNVAIDPCGICRKTLYCSEECETADFVSHRATFKDKETIMSFQKQCALCMKSTGDIGTSCDKCAGIKYCSDGCEEANKGQHELICEAYATLDPRPTKAHRVCIFFQADEKVLRLLWVPMKPYSVADNETAEGLVAPATKNIECCCGLGIRGSETYRDITCCVEIGCLFKPESARNQRLGLATGEPDEAIKCPLLVLVAQYFERKEDEGDVSWCMSDATPHDLPALLKHFTATGRCEKEARDKEAQKEQKDLTAMLKELGFRNVFFH